MDSERSSDQPPTRPSDLYELGIRFCVSSCDGDRGDTLSVRSHTLKSVVVFSSKHLRIS
jgi:hypothetical protein